MEGPITRIIGDGIGEDVVFDEHHANPPKPYEASAKGLWPPEMTRSPPAGPTHVPSIRLTWQRLWQDIASPAF